jgi:hypothetical protein
MEAMFMRAMSYLMWLVTFSSLTTIDCCSAS